MQAGGHEFESRYLHYSSLAQSVEHSAVNRVVVGSSPTGGAKKSVDRCLRIFCIMGNYSVFTIAQKHSGIAEARVRKVLFRDRASRKSLLAAL